MQLLLHLRSITVIDKSFLILRNTVEPGCFAAMKSSKERKLLRSQSIQVLRVTVPH